MFCFAIAWTLFSASKTIHASGNGNLALNPSAAGFPQVSASYTCICDNVWNTVNGTTYYSDNPRDRWTNYGSSNATDWLAVDFGSAQTFNQVKLHIYSDGGGVIPPSSYVIQYWDNGSWADVPNPSKTPAAPAAFLNTVDFNPVTSPKLQVVFTNNGGTGVVELEVFLHTTPADSMAAMAVKTVIDQLPIQTAVALSDKSAIVEVRAAYEQLTVTQKSLVTNLSKLTAAEAAIAALEASFTDVAVLSAFSNAAGNAIRLKFSTVLDATYGMQANHFLITVNGSQVAASDAAYDWTDSSGQTIKLTLTAPVLLNETSAFISLQNGAFRTSNQKYNLSVASKPVFTFKRLDQTSDNRITVDDAVRIIANPALRIDVNQDGFFDRNDVRSILEQISQPFP